MPMSGNKDLGPDGGFVDLRRSATFTPMAWNLGLNLVYYPRGRSRRSLASPYRPLFDVADNGTMITGL